MVEPSPNEFPDDRFIAELCEHLRTIHFSLLAAAFVLLVATSLRLAADLERAMSQADQVASLNAAVQDYLYNMKLRDVCAPLPNSTVSIVREIGMNRSWHYAGVDYQMDVPLGQRNEREVWIRCGRGCWRRVLPDIARYGTRCDA
jgi:hypothetical protein